MPMQRRLDQPSSSTWPWWKAAAIALFTLGGFGAVLTVIPPYSSSAMKVAIGLTLVGTVGAVWGISKANWWGGIVLLNSWFLLILGFTIRAWALVIPQVWIWLVPLVAAYLLAWALPAISPKLSARLLREQFAPETRWGRGCLTLFLVVGPAAGTLGASVGMYGSRFGQGNAVMLVIAVPSSAVAVGFAQAAAEQVWPRRPWAQTADFGSQDGAR